MNFYKKIFRKKESNPLIEFRNIESSISKILESTDILHKDFSDSRKREGEHRAELNAITIENPNLNVHNRNVEDNSLSKRLKQRKIAIVVTDAILSISAVRVLMSETLNVTNMTMLVTIVFGFLLAYLFLLLAINFKIDDAKKTSKSAQMWNQYSWMLPLIFIPFLNLYSLITHPENPNNILWVFLAVFSSVLNIKCGSYSPQYELMTNTIISEKKTKPHLEGLKKENKIQDRINRNMLDVKRSLLQPAADLKQLYLSFGENKPEIILHPLFCILLNNRYYLYQLLPIHDIEIMNPPKNMSDYLMFFDEITNNPVKIKPSNPIVGEHIPVQPNPPISTEDGTDKDSDEGPNKKNIVGPSFGDMLTNEDEIFV